MRSIDGCSKTVQIELCCNQGKDQGIEVGAASRQCKEEHCEKSQCKMGYCVLHARARNLYKPGEGGVCKEDGCIKHIVKKGYCQRHAKAHGIEIKNAKCKESDCMKLPQKKGYCMLHENTTCTTQTKEPR